jgi:hypothetical protein
MGLELEPMPEGVVIFEDKKKIMYALARTYPNRPDEFARVLQAAGYGDNETMAGLFANYTVKQLGKYVFKITEAKTTADTSEDMMRYQQTIQEFKKVFKIN